MGVVWTKIPSGENPLRQNLLETKSPRDKISSRQNPNRNYFEKCSISGRGINPMHFFLREVKIYVNCCGKFWVKLPPKINKRGGGGGGGDYSVPQSNHVFAARGQRSFSFKNLAMELHYQYDQKCIYSSPCLK